MSAMNGKLITPVIKGFFRLLLKEGKEILRQQRNQNWRSDSFFMFHILYLQRKKNLLQVYL